MDTDPQLFLAAGDACAAVLLLTWEHAVCVAIVLLLMVVSVLISGSETAFFSLSPNDINSLKNEKKRRNARLLDLVRTPEKLWATIVIVNNLVKITIVLLLTHTFCSITGFSWSFGKGFLFPAAIAVFVLLLLSEITPRMYASQNALKVSLRMAYPLSVLQRLFYPLVILFASSSALIHKRVQQKQSISIDDLSDALELNSDTTAENENILKGIVKFGNIDVHTIMTPRMDVETIDCSIKLTELFALINEWGYSRIPVYDDTPDNVKGILYVKDLLPYIEQSDDFQWQKLIRDAYFVPEHKKIDDLLKEFQEMKMHMAVIIDEYGGMIGIVTLEDILEEIVGDIADESDDDDPEYIRINDHTYLFDGKVLLNDFFRIMQIDDSTFDDVRGEADTLAGIILEMKGEIPQKGDSVDHRNFSFCIESVDNRRIKQIKVTVNEQKQ